MHQANSTTVEINLMANHLLQAAGVAMRLAEEGITVLAAMANGRRPLLCVDRMPAGVEFATKRSHPNGAGGTCMVDAAQYHGCQLERMRDVPGDWPRPSHLRSVPNG